MQSNNLSKEDYSEKLDFKDEHVVRKLSGIEHENLRCVASVFNIRVGARGHCISFVGEKKAVISAISLISHLGELLKSGKEISLADIRNAAMRMMQEKEMQPHHFLSESLMKTQSSREVRPRGPGQKAYVDAIHHNDLVFGVGPAGTGKTYLAMTLAIMALSKKRITRIILTRPAVEAGERLGFLPGNLEEKVSPYLRPLYDALFDLVGTEKAEEMVAHGIIEVAPLAFMRGRTLNDAFVILDEGQNTTPEQMKMALTRLGFGSKMVVTGDITQIDLHHGQRSGLVDAISLLHNVHGVSICKLTEKDVVRHPLVQSIIKAYDNVSAKRVL